MHGGPAPVLAFQSTQTFVVQGFSNLFTAIVLIGHLEYTSDHLSGKRFFRIGLEFIPGFFSVLDRYSMQSVWRLAAIEEAPACVLPHTALDVLSQVGAIKLVDRLDHTFKKSPGWAVIYGFVDGDDGNTQFLQQSFEYYAVLTAAGKTVKLPYQYPIERTLFRFGESNHFLECRAVSRAAAFGFVHEFTDDLVAVLKGVFLQGFDLGGKGEDSVLGI